MPTAIHEEASTSETTRFARFITTSGTSAAINMATRWLFSLLLAYETAVALAYVVGVVTAFLLARLFVFERTAGNTHVQFARFVLVNVIGFAQVWLISVGLVRSVFPAIGSVWNSETLAHLIGLGSLAATSYTLHKRFSFRGTGVLNGDAPTSAAAQEESRARPPGLPPDAPGAMAAMISHIEMLDNPNSSTQTPAAA